MPMNKQKGNMYPFCSHTWNPIRGGLPVEIEGKIFYLCPHQCSYCYMRGFPIDKLKLVESELKTNLGKGNFIFVGSSVDMYANKVPSGWIIKVQGHCNRYPTNTYLNQSKNPKRFNEFLYAFPKATILGITLETNRNYKISLAPAPKQRAKDFADVTWPIKMISIEPIMDFDLKEMIELIFGIMPQFVSIGADSQRHNLPEPDKMKIHALIQELEKFTQVIPKENLIRLLR